MYYDCLRLPTHVHVTRLTLLRCSLLHYYCTGPGSGAWSGSHHTTGPLNNNSTGVQDLWDSVTSCTTLYTLNVSHTDVFPAVGACCCMMLLYDVGGTSWLLYSSV